MGERCLRWAMKLPPDAPIEWPPHATGPMDRVRAAMLALDDNTDLPRLSAAFLSRHTGLADATISRALKRMAAGRR